jgi:hypothetical protein
MFFRTLGKALYERVLIHYKPTFIGIGAGAAIVLIDEFTTMFQSLPQGWAQAAAGVVALIGALAKSKLAEKVPATP